VKITVDQISDKPTTLQSEEPALSFPLLAEMQSDGACSFAGPVCCDAIVVREYDHLRVTGRIVVPVSLVCSRCLVGYESTLDSSFTIIFRKGTAEEASLEEETELSEQELVSAVYHGDEIDMTHEIEEQIAMEVPLQPLCSDSCKGLCPECGTDLNHETCSCSGKQFNFKFSALKDFKASR
jgi:uncharacterized protein